MTASTLDRPGAHSRSASQTLAGSSPMLHLVLRRNRVRLLVWWLVLVGLFGYVCAYYRDIFDTQAALDDFAVVSNTPSMRALTGLAAAPATLGGAVWTKIWMTLVLTLAFGVIFLVTRTGRAEEELGRTELLRSRVLGLHAYSAMAWAVIAGLCVAVGAGVALVSAAMGLDPEGAGATGSMVIGASITGLGLVALGVGAVAGQLTSTARGANALGSIVFGLFYLVRMVGDLGDGRLTWGSPVGWAQEMQPWGANRWWPVLLLLLVAAILLVVATRIEARRDLGAGLLPDRAGRPSAPRRYASPLGLGLRLQRGPIIGWTLTILLSALLFGSVVEAMTDLLDDASSSAATAMLRGTGLPALLSMLTSLIALVVAVFALQSAVGLRSDEANGIVEPQLAGARSRTAWALQRLTIPAVGSAVLLLLGGGAMGLAYGALIDDSSQAGRLALVALAYWPAVMVLTGLAVALFGWLPRLAIPMTWGVLAATWLAVLLGDALHLPSWLIDVLPFSATPYQPLEAMSWTPIAVMVLVAAALTGAGLARFRRRDVQPG